MLGAFFACLFYFLYFFMLHVCCLLPLFFPVFIAIFYLSARGLGYVGLCRFFRGSDFIFAIKLMLK